MDLAFAIPALLSCTPLFPSQYGSGISIVGGVANLGFAFMICWKGGLGWRDFRRLFGGDEGIKTIDFTKGKEE